MAFIISTAAVAVVRSGTSFTIDVTAANLSEDLNTKDFIILDQTNEVTLSNASFTKTSQTLLTYSGVDIGTNISLEVRRNTAVARFQEQQFGNKFASNVYNEEIDRILGKIFEIVLFGTGETQFFIPTPQNEPYGVSWSSDVVRGRTANVLYNEMELMPRLAQNENVSGSWAFQSDVSFEPPSGTTIVAFGADVTAAINGPLDVNSSTADFTGATSMTRSTPGTAVNNTEVATTAFTRNAIQTYVLDILTTTINNNIDDKLVGHVAHYPSGAVPTNWLLCNGATFSTTQYPKLNTFLGGNTLPNYLGRFILAADGVTYLLGTTGGFTDSVVVAHNHGIVDPGHAHSGVIRQGNSGLTTDFTNQQDLGSTNTATTGITIGFEGVSGIGRNIPPYIALNIYIYAGTSQT